VMEWEWEGVYDGAIGDWRGRAVVLKSEAEARLRWYERLDTMTGCSCSACTQLRERGRS